MELALETRSPWKRARTCWCWGSTATARVRRPRSPRWTGRSAACSRACSRAEKFEGKPGQISYFHTEGAIPAERVLVVGLGPLRRGARARDAETMRRATAAAVRRARDLGAATIAVFMPAAALPARERAQAMVEGAMLGTYRFDKYLKEKNGKVVRALTVLEPDRRSAAAAREGVRVGRIAAEATLLARDLVNEPANVVTPTFLARRAAEIAKEGGLTVKRPGPGRVRQAGHGRLRGRGAGQRGAAQVHPPHLHARRAGPAPRGGDRQGHHLRFRRARPQDRRRHAADEGRHVGRRRGARHLPGPAAAQAAGRGARADRGHREHALRHRPAAGRHRAGHERAHHRDRQHRRGGPAHPGRCPRLRGQAHQAGRDDRHGHADRRGGHRAGPGGVRRHGERRRARRSACWPPPTGRGSGCGACRSTTSTRTGSRATWPISTTSRASAGPGPSWRGSSCASSPRACRGRTSTSRAPRSPSGSCRWGPRAAPAWACGRCSPISRTDAR